jgi:hypothetical protein
MAEDGDQLAKFLPAWSADESRGPPCYSSLSPRSARPTAPLE